MHVPQGDVSEQTLILDNLYKLEAELPEVEKAIAIFKQTFAQARSLSVRIRI
ncbi:hypothetical protein DB42_BV00280 [Neochlamydia sp. EPS4]|uniref:hypothetical protein n=1 Tax=Neochlamydia sp. EPS4 TaxID=1478175 RepID=UPI000582CEFA|nr:hypothetical protein [Neochlamydia sp. EPS4]KIC73641.1 hypothetical protein DB42_BV00280 [Neochlamydia sp. EPS4]